MATTTTWLARWITGIKRIELMEWLSCVSSELRRDVGLVHSTAGRGHHHQLPTYFRPASVIPCEAWRVHTELVRGTAVVARVC